MASEWKAYNDLAWTEAWLADPSEYESEVRVYVDLIRKRARKPPQTVFHLGSGAGGHDCYFKREFTVTGVDLSDGMLERAKGVNPEIEYIVGDMRTVRLNRFFDAVVIPDSIDYMTTESDLKQVFDTAAVHLKKGGVLLIVAKTTEAFRGNNFAYSGERQGVSVTLFENNYIDPLRPNRYEATFVYLIRRGGELTLHSDRHILGLFPYATWEALFSRAGFSVQAVPLGGLYDRYLIESGEYPMTVFVAVKD